MKKYQNKYRIPSARAQWWNYGWNGSYFITICTAKRKCFFGSVANGKMELSRTGILADLCWYIIPQHFPNVELGDYVVMPNHMHGILILNKPKFDESTPSPPNVQTLPPNVQTLPPNVQTAPPNVQTLHATSLPDGIDGIDGTQPPNKNQQMSDISPDAETVSAICRSYKSAVTFHANRLGLENGWHPRFHDHIIRNDGEYQRISDYIIANPENWKDDKFYNR